MVLNRGRFSRVELERANMTVKYIILHWTGGGQTPNKVDLNAYQLLIDYKGYLHAGQPQGKTASTGGMNSITYNISCCGGGTIKLTNLQCEKLFKTTAEVLKKYGLPIKNVYTHAEIGQMVKDKTITKLLPHNKWLNQNIGKIDLTTLPYNLKGLSHGDFIRHKIQWYYNKL